MRALSRLFSLYVSFLALGAGAQVKDLPALAFSVDERSKTEVQVVVTRTPADADLSLQLLTTSDDGEIKVEGRTKNRKDERCAPADKRND